MLTHIDTYLNVASHASYWHNSQKFTNSNNRIVLHSVNWAILPSRTLVFLNKRATIQLSAICRLCKICYPCSSMHPKIKMHPADSQKKTHKTYGVPTTFIPFNPIPHFPQSDRTTRRWREKSIPTSPAQHASRVRPPVASGLLRDLVLACCWSLSPHTTHYDGAVVSGYTLWRYLCWKLARLDRWNLWVN